MIKELRRNAFHRKRDRAEAIADRNIGAWPWDALELCPLTYLMWPSIIRTDDNGHGLDNCFGNKLLNFISGSRVDENTCKRIATIHRKGFEVNYQRELQTWGYRAVIQKGGTYNEGPEKRKIVIPLLR